MDYIMDVEKDFDIIKGIAKEAGREGSLHTLEFLGFDVGNPTSVQKDVAYLHDLRKRKEFIVSKVLGVIIAVGVPTGLYFMWEVFKISLNN